MDHFFFMEINVEEKSGRSKMIWTEKNGERHENSMIV